jgi:kinesin family protein 5
MAYGQTSSGKTYTMQGANIDLFKQPEKNGLISRTIDGIFDFISTSPSHIEFTVKISVVEIYMEELNDLLDPKK